jgi:serine/threonine protein kinase
VQGTPFGRYQLLELIGRGGMGEVWRAHDTETDRVVAIKVLPAHLSDDESFQERFRREAHAAARLNNPHIIPIHNYGEIDGRLYVDMRLIEGSDLHNVLAGGPLEPDRAVRIIEQVAKALNAAHKVGLVHRDVKPSNILLDEDYFAYLIDFGLARATGETRLTNVGNAVGTFHYMAPERLGDKPNDDARADIYALACVLYECLTGQPPFTTSSVSGLIAAHLNEAPPQPSTSQPDVPRRLDTVIATGMAKNPDQRYATTVALARAAQDAITTPIGRPPERVSREPPTQRLQTPSGPTPTQRVQTPPPLGPTPTQRVHTPPPPTPYKAVDASGPQPQRPPPGFVGPTPGPPQAPAYQPPPSLPPGAVSRPLQPGAQPKRRRPAVVFAVLATLGIVAVVVTVIVILAWRPEKTRAVPSSSVPTDVGGHDRVVVDGQNQDISGATTCTTSSDGVSISIGSAQVSLTDAVPPVVETVFLGTVNGVYLTYSETLGEGSAEATRDGKTYKITGTATGFDLANGFEQVSKPFEIDVTCP